MGNHLVINSSIQKASVFWGREGCTEEKLELQQSSEGWAVSESLTLSEESHLGKGANLEMTSPSPREMEAHDLSWFVFWLSHKERLLGAAAAAKSLQSCPTLCDPIDGSPPGSPVAGILQARTLEWVAISFSNAWKRKVKGKSLNRVRLLATS